MKSKKKFVVLSLGIILLLLAVGVVLLARNSHKKTCTHCNILLIDIDILRADELPCYGYKRDTAPNLCAFAQQSVLFEDNYAPGPWTLPSIFSTITSLYPTFHRVRLVFIDKLSSSIPTLAEVLHDEGYKTIYVGPNEDNKGSITTNNGGLRGYDQIISDESLPQVIAETSKDRKPWFIHYYTSDLHSPYLLPNGVQPMVNLPQPKGFSITESEYKYNLNKWIGDHYHEMFTEKTIEQYKDALLQAKNSQTFAFSDLFNKLCIGSRVITNCLTGWAPFNDAYLQFINPDNPSDIAYLRMMYDSVIHLLDQKLGSYLLKMDAGPLAQNTITIIMSDHGDAFFEHGMFGHENDFHTELYHTPLIIHAPGLPAERVSHSTGNMDIFPTILDLLGMTTKSILQGNSVLPYIDHPQIDPSFFTLSEDYFSGVLLQNRDWLYFLPEEALGIEDSKLYQKSVDPQENNNVANKFPLLTQTLYNRAAVLRSYETIISNAQPLQDVNTIKIDPKKIERMKKEGYF